MIHCAMQDAKAGQELAEASLAAKELDLQDALGKLKVCFCQLTHTT